MSRQRLLIVLSGLAIVIALTLCLPAVRDMERVAGFHPARAGLFVAGLLCGGLGGLCAGIAVWTSRGRYRFTAAVLLAVNLITAAAVVVYARWPRTREVMQAVRRGDDAQVRAYAKLGADLEARERWGWNHRYEGSTPLTAAVEQGDVAMVMTLLESGADINALDGHKNAPLHQAVIANNAKLVELLLEHGADIDRPGHTGETPLHTAIKFLWPDMVELLLTKGADPNLGRPIDKVIQISPELLESRKFDEVGLGAMIQQLAKHGADLDGEIANNRTPLTAALLAGRPTLAGLLVEGGADPHREDGHATTPLVAAAQLGDVESVQVLLAAGANVNHHATRGKTPLNASLYAGQLDVAIVLLAAGADLHQEDGMGHAPILAAVNGSTLNDRTDILRFVLERGANPRRTNLNDNRGSPLAAAAGSGNIELATMLLNAGVDPDEKHQEVSSPLMEAVSHGHLEMVKLLVSRGADVNGSGSRNQSPLDHARRSKRSDIEAYLLEQGARPAED